MKETFYQKPSLTVIEIANEQPVLHTSINDPRLIDEEKDSFD